MALEHIPVPRRVLVTGASGAVGSAVRRRLVAEGCTVRAVARHPSPIAGDTVEWRPLDIVDRAGLTSALDGMEGVVHCAAALSDDMASCQRTNVQGVASLLEAMQARGCRQLVHLSSVSVYDHRQALAFDEESPRWTEPLDAYGFTKAEGERLVQAAGGDGLDAVILRPVVVLSMHRTSYWGPLAIERARSTAEPVWPLAEVPFVDVDNLADAVLRSLTQRCAVGHAYNVVDGSAPASEYLAAVATALGRGPPSVAPRAPRLVVSGERIRRELGYSPENRWAHFLAQLAAGSVEA
jgi:nucleoside-diphosphate-sugar epimerase